MARPVLVIVQLMPLQCLGPKTTSAPSIPIVLLEILNFVFIELPVLQGILREHDLERMNVI